MSKHVITLVIFAILSLTQATDFPYNHFYYAAHMIPHPDKVAKGGEDAFYADETVLSVADGVGGWANHGIDPSFYSKTLCSGIGDLRKESPEKYENNPKKLMFDTWARDTHIGS